LTKPLNMQFLAVRITSLLTGENVVQRGKLFIDPDSMTVTWDQQSLNLTLTEFWLIEALARRPNQVKSYDNLMQITRQSYVERNTINGYVRRIRSKFKAIDSEFNRIETVFGVGYKWKSNLVD